MTVMPPDRLCNMSWHTTCQHILPPPSAALSLGFSHAHAPSLMFTQAVMLGVGHACCAGRGTWRPGCGAGEEAVKPPPKHQQGNDPRSRAEGVGCSPDTWVLWLGSEGSRWGGGGSSRGSGNPDTWALCEGVGLWGVRAWIPGLLPASVSPPPRNVALSHCCGLV